MILLASLIFLLRLTSASSSNSSNTFNPLTEDRAFRTTFRVQAFAENQPDYVGEIFEQYQPVLANGDIWLKQRIGSKANKIERRRFVYQGASRRLVEIVDLGQDDEQIETYLWQDGGSSSYKTEVQVDESEMRENPSVLPLTSTLDSKLFGHNKKGDHTLNLDLFLTKPCQDKINQKLHHVKGLARLLHVIECRRDEFKSMGSSSAGSGKTRDIPKRSFEAIKLANGCASCQSVGKVTHLNMTVSVRTSDLAHRSDGGSKTLPTRIMPLSITIEYQNAFMIINLFNFETIALSEHLSESSSSESSFLMPLVSGAMNLLTPDAPNKRRRIPDQFTFRAQLTGSQLYFSDPIELVVVYDRKLKYLARKMKLIDRSVVEGDSYSMRTMQLVADGRSRLKYHIMPSNTDHVKSDSESGDDKWTTCVANLLTVNELDTIETIGGSLFDINDAVYMGMAIVRGAACHVYEKRVYNLPMWMGLGSYEHVQHDQLAGSEIYVTIYEAADRVSKLNLADEEQKRQDDIQLGKLMRLVISYVLPASKSGNSSANSERDFGALKAKLNFELLAFNWTLESANDLPELYDISEECLISRFNSRHIELDTILAPDGQTGDQIKLSNLLDKDQSKLNELASQMLNDNFGLAPSQQVELVASLNRQDHLEVKVKAYELPRERFATKFIDFARDQSIGNIKLASWSIGVTSVSLEECLWRAAHTIDLSAIKSDYQRTMDNTPHSLVMFCPRSKHCVVGDNEKWAPMRKRQPVSIDSVIAFPYEEPADESSQKRKCLLFSVEASQSNLIPYADGLDTGGRPLLDWLVTRRGHFLDLPVDFSFGGLTFPMVVKKFKLSNIYNSIDSFGGLSRPLQGVGYYLDDKSDISVSVATAAQCSHYCAMDHRCQSYSICRRSEDKLPIRLDCSLSKVNWTEPMKVKELNDLVFSPSIGAKSTQLHKISVFLSSTASDDDDEEVNSGDNNLLREQPLGVEVALRKSNLCSLHSQTSSVVDAFQFKGTNLDSNPGVGFLLAAKSIDECAQFCLSRAHVINSINYLRRRRRRRNADEQPENSDETDEQQKQRQQTLGRFDEFMRLTGGQANESGQTEPQREQLTSIKESVCTQIKFNVELGVCLLSPPMAPINEMTFASAELAGLKTSSIAKYVTAHKRIQTRSADQLPHFLEYEVYELDEERLYDSHRNLRLVAPPPAGQLAGVKGKLQATIADTTASECAGQCLRLHNCRSFDVLQVNLPIASPDQQASGRSSLSSRVTQAAGRLDSTCVLNGESMFAAAAASVDIDKDLDRKLKIERVYGASLDDNTSRRPSNSTSGGGPQAFTWRHYEPTELALFVSGAIDYDRYWRQSLGGNVISNRNSIDGEAASSPGGGGGSIFLRVRSIAKELEAANGKNEANNSNSSNGNGKANETRNEKHNVMLAPVWMLISIALLSVILLLIAQRRGLLPQIELPAASLASISMASGNLLQPLVGLWRSTSALVNSLVGRCEFLHRFDSNSLWPLGSRGRREPSSVSASDATSPFGFPYDRHL